MIQATKVCDQISEISQVMLFFVFDASNIYGCNNTLHKTHYNKHSIMYHGSGT